MNAELPQITVGVIQGIQTYATGYDLTAITAAIGMGTDNDTGWSHANNIITLSETGAITISGTASGYSVVVSDSIDITLAAGTEIIGKNQYAALTVPDGATITGDGADVNITGGTSNNNIYHGTTGGVITVKYNGSTAVPKDTGTYTVTADISGGTDYTSLGNIGLGSYTIAKETLTFIGFGIAAKTYDGTVRQM